MTKMIRCDCGYVAQGDSDEQLVSVAQRHAREVHAMDLTPQQVLAMAEPA